MHKQILNNLDALLITNPVNIRYLTGFVGVDPTVREAYALLHNTSTILFVSPLYKESAEKLQTQHLVITFLSQGETIEKKLLEVLHKKEKGNITLGFEEKNLTVFEHTKLQKQFINTNISLFPTKNRVEQLRQIKTYREIRHIRKACNITDSCYTHILPYLVPGVTEADIYFRIETYIQKKHALLAFTPIVAFGKNTSMPHYNKSRTSNTKIQTKDIVLLDFGARVHGYCSDMTRTIFIGKPKQELVKAYETILEAKHQTTNYIRNTQSPSGAKADRVARTYIKNKGYTPYPHSLGHGLGLEIHEAPRLTIKKDATLAPHMVFTIEPAIYVPGKFGIRAEDTTTITKNHSLIHLTTSTMQ